jgi:Tfp pilus assembly protein FimT
MTKPRWPTPQRGVTLVELALVMVGVGILGVYAIANSAVPAVYGLPSQSQVMAGNLRHAQALALTWGRSLRFTAAPGANGTYSVSCVTAGSSPCNASPVLDPATGAAFTVSLEKGVVLGGSASVDFDSSGKPSAAASFTLATGGSTKTVSVAALTGRVTVAP